MNHIAIKYSNVTGTITITANSPRPNSYFVAEKTYYYEETNIFFPDLIINNDTIFGFGTEFRLEFDARDLYDIGIRKIYFFNIMYDLEIIKDYNVFQSSMNYSSILF